MTNLTKPKPLLKLWSAEPAPENLGHLTDVVLRTTLPNGGEYCHRFAIDPRRASYLTMAEMPLVVRGMDDTLNLLLERGFDE